jgi:hypothetical protein
LRFRGMAVWIIFWKVSAVRLDDVLTNDDGRW